MSAKRLFHPSTAIQKSLPPENASATLSLKLQLWNPAAGIVFGPVISETTAPNPRVDIRARSIAASRKGSLLFARPSRPNCYAVAFSARYGAERLVHTTSAGQVRLQDSLGDAVQSAERGIDDALKTAQSIAGELIQGAGEAEEEAEADENRDGTEDAETTEQSIAGVDGVAGDATQPPVTTLAYKMPLEEFRAAKEAMPGSAASFWSYAQYRHVDDGSRVKVHYCRSLQTTERVCRQYFEGEPVLGFDLEWMWDAARWHSARKNVCLVQLASPSRIGLFHLALYPAPEPGMVEDVSSLMAPSLRRILEDPGTIKTGVSVRGDGTRLRNHLGVDVRGMMELSHLYKLVRYSRTGDLRLINKKLVSLEKQVLEHLQLPLFKGSDVRSSDWSKPLSIDQIQYSASDAYASLQVFSVLERERENLRPTPPRPAFAELGLPIQLAARKDQSSSAPRRAAKAPTTTTTTTTTESAEKRRRKTAETSKARQRPPRDARVVAANEWLAWYRSRADGQQEGNETDDTPTTKPTTTAATARAQPAWLRAYYLWHRDESLGPAAVASLLRDPPLQTSTVVGYILQAVRAEGLPFNHARLQAELLERLPAGQAMTRFRSLVKACSEAERVEFINSRTASPSESSVSASSSGAGAGAVSGTGGRLMSSGQ